MPVLCVWSRSAPSDDELLAHLNTMAAALDVPAKLNKTMPEVEAYFKGCKEKMRPNPFHNWNHVLCA
eukprot:SAG31_NODE_14911_length_781_cov_1.055718_1_plen_67_part_00